jgi:DNA-3-methyladenine glycosylase
VRITWNIVETEAYEGIHDLASHSSKGRASRTEVMFGPAGCVYVYRIYGLHWMLNVVTGPESEAAAVLIRGFEGLNGPGRVTAALGIDASFYGKEARPETGLWFESATNSRNELADTGDPTHWGCLRRTDLRPQEAAFCARLSHSGQLFS